MRSKNPVQWRFKVTQAEVSTDAGTEKQYVWSAEPVEADKDDVCQVAHNWVVTFDPANGEPAFTRPVEYEGKAIEPAAPEKEGCEFTGWYLNENDEFDFNTTITADTTPDGALDDQDRQDHLQHARVCGQGFTDVVHLNNPETYDANDLPITLNAPKLKNDEWPQKFSTGATRTATLSARLRSLAAIWSFYAYWQFPVRYTVYDENGNVIDSLSTTGVV